MLWTPESMLGGIQQMQSNLPSTPSITTWGTTITSGAGVDTLGAYSSGQLIASTNFDVYMMEIWIAGTSASATDTSTLMNIGLGASGSEIDFIKGLMIGWTDAATIAPRSYRIPCFIPAGTRIAARTQSITSSRAAQVLVFLYGAPGHSGALHRPPTVFETVGTTLTGSRGTSHTPGSTQIYSSWASFGSTTTIDAHYIHLMCAGQGTKSDTTMTNIAYITEIGISSGVVIFGDWWHGNTTLENQVACIPRTWMPCSIASGTQLQLRSMGNGTAEAQDFSIILAR